ncbi:hypothetical protein [Saccharopolyspora sp. ASAGF58]|uniref:hypothetical protein n=1 Tax=Saccharopolyspora sp. ASAGF58 TaxID=2719023 RepID=UPI0014402608|nr:hypothetical protein [Saccharopolyspora sp. ASAGF58]QIZ36949.1 hypothetical protein FDZ84_22735 [Saccharopolyspora sp. ASAGF58]
MSLWEQRVTQARQLWINGDHAAAEPELRTVLADGDFDSAVHANCLLGALLDERDAAAGARAMYRAELGDVGAAVEAFRRAESVGAGSRVPTPPPTSRFCLPSKAKPRPRGAPSNA